MHFHEICDFPSFILHLAGRTAELIETLADGDVDVACIQELYGEVVVPCFLELKAKDISCCGLWMGGTIVRRYLTV